jgi:hypothetical protein
MNYCIVSGGTAFILSNDSNGANVVKMSHWGDTEQ